MRDDRAVSDVIGFVLIFSLVASTVAILSVSGFGALENARDTEQLNNAERAFDVLADNMADIHGEGAPSRATEISLEEASLRTADPILVNVSGIPSSGPVRTAQFEVTPVVYESENGGRIIYANGAVLRVGDDGGTLMTEAPPILLGDERIVVPVVQTRHVGAVDSISGQTVRVRAERISRSLVFFEHESSYEEVVLNVTTPRNDVWAANFEDNPDTTCTTPDDETVLCTVDDPEKFYVTVTRIDTEFEG